jgi:putative sterol carrier protein
MSDKTPQIIFEQDIPSQMKDNPGRAKEVNAVYQFNITGTGGGEWFVDLTKEGGEIGAGQHPAAKCTINTDADTFVKIATGKMAGPQAFLTGKLKIKGDMSLATKLGKVLGK